MHCHLRVCLEYIAASAVVFLLFGFLHVREVIFLLLGNSLGVFVYFLLLWKFVGNQQAFGQDGRSKSLCTI